MFGDRTFFPATPVCRRNLRILVAKDSAGQKLGYFYYEEEPGRRSSAKLLSKDEARRSATNVAKLTLMAATATSS
jgi:hypothetical protein